MNLRKTSFDLAKKHTKLMKFIGAPGHCSTLQSSVMLEGPEHSNPPYADSIFLSRVIFLLPPAHVLEHSPTSHLFHMQLTIVNHRNIGVSYTGFINTIKT